MSASNDDERQKLVNEEFTRRLILRGIGGLAAVSTGAAVSQTAGAAPVSGMQLGDSGREMPMAQTGVEALTGSWTYRSFLNDPTPGVPFNSLFFAEAELVIDAFDPGSFSGRLVFPSGGEMTLIGASSFGNPFSVRFQGRGASPGIEDYVYDYVGYLVPVWPNGVDQVPAIVGSVVRTEPHKPNAQPGQVASWIAVKRT